MKYSIELGVVRRLLGENSEVFDRVGNYKENVRNL